MAQRSKLLGRDGVKKVCVVCLVGASMSSFEGSLAWMLYWSNVLFLLDTLKPCYLQTLSIIKASAKSTVLQKSPCWRSKHVLCKSPCWRSKHCFVSRPVVGEAKNYFASHHACSTSNHSVPSRTALVAAFGLACREEGIQKLGIRKIWHRIQDALRPWKPNNGQKLEKKNATASIVKPSKHDNNSMHSKHNSEE